MTYLRKKTEAKTTQKGSVRNFIFILIATLLVGATFLFAEYRNNKTTILGDNIYVAPETREPINPDSQYKDSDGDGIKDWEEILVGTDPYNPKSNNLKASVSSAKVIKDLTKNNTPEDPIDTLSKEFFSRYMELRQLGISKDKLSQQELIQKTTSSISLAQPKEYLISEIIASNNSDKESVKGYGNEIAMIFKKYSITSRNEAVIAKDAIQKENPEILKELDPIILSYKNMLNTLLKINAPKDMAVMHLDLINSINGAIFIAQSFRKSAIDPLIGIQAVAMYQIMEKKSLNALIAFRSYFSYLGISYTSDEPGFIFTK